MLIPRLFLLAGLSLFLVGSLSAQSKVSPYAGEESRPIKALSPQQVRGLLAGEGLGYAKAAELNQYPGPRHVLDLEKDMALKPHQREKIESIFREMNKKAMAIGQKIVEKERELDRLFATKAIQPAKLRDLTLEIGQLEGQLRAVHLEAHLETTAVMTREQVTAYDRLRGYHGGGMPGEHNGKGHDQGQQGMSHDPASMHGGQYKGHAAEHAGEGAMPKMEATH